jgi:NAD(P)-dependent dehydrogenase (short-subunit alcohol dehydrogenase family)
MSAAGRSVGRSGGTRIMNDSRVYLITGMSDIGRAAALRLVQQGARVAVVDVDPAACDRVRDAVEGSADVVATYTAEIADGAVAQRIVADVLAHWGHLDGLVACAEITGSNVPVVDMPMAEWARVLSVNLRGTFVYCKAVAPALLARGRGAIVVTSSHLAYEGAPGATHYAATKGAVESLMRSLACALGPQRIRVNALAPGLTETAEQGPRRAELPAHQPLGRLGTPEEVAAGITYLLSDEADFVTGQVLHVNGGCVMP